MLRGLRPNTSQSRSDICYMELRVLQSTLSGHFMTPYVAQLDSARSRPSQSCRLLCRQGLSSARTLKTSNPLADAGTIAKNVLHIAINASYAAVTWHLSDQNIRPGPTTPDLIIKLQQVAAAACDF